MAMTKEERKAYNKAYREAHREKLKESCAVYRKVNSEKIKKSRRAYYEANPEKVKERNRAYREANPERVKELNRAYREVNPEKIKILKRDWASKKIKNNPIYALKCRIRHSIRESLTKKNYTKTSRTYEILGCDYETFAAHLESQFVDGMNWDNRNEWHIDHIIPIASAQTEEDVLRLNHYTNLRPLWAEENLLKSDTMPPVHIQQRVKRDYAKSKGVRIPLKQQTMFELFV